MTHLALHLWSHSELDLQNGSSMPVWLIDSGSGQDCQICYGQGFWINSEQDWQICCAPDSQICFAGDWRMHCGG